MNEVGIFIDPNKELESEINFWKEKFRNTFGYQLFIDHPPHITLHNFYTDNLDRILNELEDDKFDSLYTLNTHISKTSYFPEDYQTHTTNLHYLVNKNDKLSDLEVESTQLEQPEGPEIPIGLPPGIVHQWDLEVVALLACLLI